MYEQAPALMEVGAGPVMAPNAVRLLRRLGVMEQFLRRAAPLEWGWEFRRWADGSVLSVERPAEVCERLHGEQTYVVHRSDLLDTVGSAVPAGWVRPGARCTAVETTTDRVLLRFADGSRVEADVVIGADGIHSVVRGTVPESAPQGYSGVCTFRTIVPAEAAPAFALRPAQTLWPGPGRHFVHYPVAGGTAVNVVAFAPAGDFTDESWSATATTGEFQAEFAGWDARVTDLIAADGVPGRWALLDRAPPKRWSRGRVTLLGDAAHPMFPFFAQGAAQSVEDAAPGPLPGRLPGRSRAGTEAVRSGPHRPHHPSPAGQSLPPRRQPPARRSRPAVPRQGAHGLGPAGHQRLDLRP